VAVPEVSHEGGTKVPIDSPDRVDAMIIFVWTLLALYVAKRYGLLSTTP
jgi:hypothetical protein